MKGLFGDLNNRLFTADGLNQTIADPRFQMGIGLLGRTDQPFGRAMGGTMQDMTRMQALQQENQRRQAEADRLAQQQQWVAQNMPSMAGAPDALQLAAYKSAASANTPFTMSPGSVLFDPVSGKPIYSAPTKPTPGMSLYVDPETGEVSFASGPGVTQGVPLGTKGQNATDATALSAMDSLARMKTVAEDYKKDYLTYQGKFAAGAYKLADKANVPLGDEQKRFLAGKTRFTNSVEQLFNAYRKEITGAAASVQELDRLKQSLLNTDMSPTEFEAAFEQFSSLAQRQLSLAAELKTQGITGKRLVQMLNEDYASMLQEAPKPGPEAGGVNMDALDAEIKRRGLKLETGGGF